MNKYRYLISLSDVIIEFIVFSCTYMNNNVWIYYNPSFGESGILVVFAML